MNDDGQILDQAVIKQLHENYKNTPQADVLQRTITQNGVNAAATDPAATIRLDPVFSLEVKTGKVTNQRRSGLCWIFSTTNMLRHNFAQKYNVKDFELSEKYLFFWDKIERANIFYECMIATASRPVDDREVAFYLSMPDEDGGQWAMAAGLVEKYGVVPASAYPETANSKDSSGFSLVLNQKLRKDGLKLRELVNHGASDDEIKRVRQAMLQEVYRLAAYSLGEPPTSFDLVYRDDKDNYHRDNQIKPLDFYHKYFDMDLSDYVVATNSPDKPMNQLYALPSEDNIIGGRKIEFVNLPMTALEQTAIAQLQDGETVWFGNDVLLQMDRKTGYLDSQLYRYDELFDINTQMTKAQRLAYHDAAVSHAMTLTGVDLVDGQPRKWKVENSWGDKSGNTSYFTMNENWMQDYVYEVVANKKYLSDEQQAILKQTPIVLPAWDSLA